jgi:hypothetical protein
VRVQRRKFACVQRWAGGATPRSRCAAREPAKQFSARTKLSGGVEVELHEKVQGWGESGGVWMERKNFCFSLGPVATPKYACTACETKKQLSASTHTHTHTHAHRSCQRSPTLWPVLQPTGTKELGRIPNNRSPAQKQHLRGKLAEGDSLVSDNNNHEMNN